VHRWGNPQRCFYGANTAPATAAVFGFVSLYNDAGAQYALAILDIGTDPDANSLTAGYVVAQGKLGAGDIRGLHCVTDGLTGPGVVTQGTVGTLPTTFSYFPTLNGVSPAWLHDFPMFVLLPGWSLTSYGLAVNTHQQASFIWEIVLPIDILNPRIGDPSIDER
jgi:hypothetical protein